MRLDGGEEVSVSGREEVSARQDGRNLVGTQADDTVFRAMFDCAPDALLAVEEGGQIVQANRNAETVFGYRPDELIGQPLELLIPEAAQAAHAGHMRNYFSKPAPRSMGQELELSARRKDGTEFPVNVSLNTVRIGDRIVALAAVRDVTEKMRTRQALRKSENRLRSVFDNIQDAIFICDPETSKIVEANHRACSLLGYTREELLAQPISALHPDDLEDVQTLFSTALRGKTALTEELTCCAKSGAKFPIEVTASPLDPTGESGAHMVMAIVKDISERREAEGTLRRSEERFSKMFRTSPLPISLARVSDGIILDVNEQFCFTSGFERDEVVGKSVFDLNLLTDPEQRQNLVETLQTDGHVHGLDVTMRRKDGEHRSLLYSAEIVEVDDVPCVLASALDITERKAAEEALRLSEERFSKAVSATGDGVAISTIAEGRLLDVNDAFCRVSGYTREELVGRTALELNIWPEMKQREALMREMQAAGSVRDLEVTLRAKDGTQRTILFAGDFIAHEGQKCILGIGKDITDRKKLGRRAATQRGSIPASARSPAGRGPCHPEQGDRLRQHRRCPNVRLC